MFLFSPQLNSSTVSSYCPCGCSFSPSASFPFCTDNKTQTYCMLNLRVVLSLNRGVLESLKSPMIYSKDIDTGEGNLSWTELIERSSDCSGVDVTVVKGGGHSQRQMDGLTDSHSVSVCVCVCVCKTCAVCSSVLFMLWVDSFRCSSHSGAAIPVDGILFPWIEFPLFLRQC